MAKTKTKTKTRTIKVRVTKPFSYAFRGVDVVDYPPGVVDLPEDVAELAIREAWAVKARGAAPENKALGSAPEDKES